MSSDPAACVTPTSIVVDTAASIAQVIRTVFFPPVFLMIMISSY
jgi:hypothetical protein